MNAFTKAKKCVPPCIGSIKSNLSPKGGISGIVGAASNSFLTLFGSFMDEVKVVYVGQDVSAYLSLPASHYFLQPCSCQNTAEVVAYILKHPQWRLSLQTHKLIHIQ